MKLSEHYREKTLKFLANAQTHNLTFEVDYLLLKRLLISGMKGFENLTDEQLIEGVKSFATNLMHPYTTEAQKLYMDLITECMLLVGEDE